MIQTVAILSHSKKLHVERQKPIQKIGCTASQLSKGFPLPLRPQEGLGAFNNALISWALWVAHVGQSALVTRVA